MKRAACGVMMVLAVLLLAPLPSQAGGHGWRGHGRHGHGWYGHGRPDAACRAVDEHGLAGGR